MSGQESFMSNKKLSLKDKATFNFVFKEYYKPLVLFASNFLNNDKIIAEDFVQDVFTKILQKSYSFDGVNSLKSFLYTSVKNSCLDHNKHIKVRSLYADEKKMTEVKEMFFLNQVLEEEIYAHLVKAVEQLPEKCKHIFKLSLLGTKNYEIATKLKISVETVKSQKRRGKKILYKLVKPILHLF